ncbi:MAG: alpha/beta hydrolase [Clostridia bacterium]|nr:alpha/beta hydrolase [Clostridia bacterium]
MSDLISPVIRTVSVGDVSMGYCSFGRGAKPFVILPGLSLKSVLLSADALAAGFSMFCDDYTVYVFDRRTNLPDHYTVSRMADDTAAIMNALGISGACVFGASQGGMMAQLIAARNPGMVSRMVLGSTAMKVSDPAESVIGEWISLAEAGDICGLNRSFSKAVYCEETQKAFAAVFSAMENDGTPEDVERFLILARAIAGFDASAELAEMKRQPWCPKTLVLGSHGDRVLTGEASEALAALLGCESYLYEGYGHAVYDEAPDYRARMKAFFEKT